MNYMEFKAQVVDMIREVEGPGTEVGIHRVPKNNGIVLDALTILRPGRNISPTVYLEKYYRFFCMGNVPLGEVVGDILREHAAHDVSGPVDAGRMVDFANVKDRIYPRLVHYSRNRGFLEGAPHRRLLDLAVLYYFEISEKPIGEATMILRNRDLARWQMQEEELYNLAMANVRRDKPVVMIPMEEILDEINANPIPEEGRAVLFRRQMKVVTNEERFYGSVCLLEPEVFQTLAEEAGENLFLLPSSIHEIIALPDDGTYSRIELERMVIDVNNTQVMEQEVLSDHVYRYDRMAGKVLY